MSNEVAQTKPEIMSPAGYWPQLRAAVEAGADSVYFGLKHFTARAKVGFTLEELPEVMRTLHARGVRGFITFNTLIFEHELHEAARTIAAIAEAGADALIIQDVGALHLARQIAPGLELHASTQMSITDAAGARMAKRSGVARVTLARELSFKEIAAIRAETDAELEMFVHGALCVAYSGQCFSSEAWGGRSANRGQCAQACRLPYDLIVDGRHEPLADARYLLSPGDLYTLEHVPEIVALGVSALKIEGRYKDAEYVALTTGAYRKAVDQAFESLPFAIDPREKLRLEQAYSRGLGPFFVSGTNHQTVVNGRAPRHRGICMGEVLRLTGDSVIVKPAAANVHFPLKPGDGVVFDAADWRSPEEREEGGRVYEVRPLPDGALELRFGNNAIEPSRIHAGDLLWRTHDPELDRVVRPFLEATTPVARQAVRVRVVAKVGEALRTEWALVRHPEIAVSAQSESPLSEARNRTVSPEFVREQLGRLGNTAYELADVELELQGSPFLPSSLLNEVRRNAVAQLQDRQTAMPARLVADAAQIVSSSIPNAVTALPGEPALHLLVRTAEQLEAALAQTPASITLDYLDLYGLKPSVDRVKQHGIEVRVASPRILKPGEEKIVDFLVRLDAPILVRSGGLLETLQSREARQLVGDFSLNAANSITAASFLAMGLQRITPTHDLNAHQVAQLAERVGGDCIEAIAYQHLPVFHTEHCVFCRFLSTGTSYKDCGRPCEKHVVSLRDFNGRTHPLMADIGCRNTVFGAEAQQASEHMCEWLAAGIRHFRLEFAHETAEQVTRVTKSFRNALSGKISYDKLAAELKRIAPQGTTEGSLFVPVEHLTLTVLQ